MDKIAAFKEVEKLGLIVEVQERTVEDRFIWILGEKFDAEDMYETLSEVRHDGSRTYITDHRMAKALMSIGVIKGTSASWGTEVYVERLNTFLGMLKEALRASKSEMVA